MPYQGLTPEESRYILTRLKEDNAILLRELFKKGIDPIKSMLILKNYNEITIKKDKIAVKIGDSSISSEAEIKKRFRKDLTVKGWAIIENRQDSLYIDGRKIVPFARFINNLGGYELREVSTGRLVRNPIFIQAILNNSKYLIPKSFTFKKLRCMNGAEDEVNSFFWFFWARVSATAGGGFYTQILCYNPYGGKQADCEGYLELGDWDGDCGYDFNAWN